MNIVAITAGAAGMYCGSCIRDNALAAELKAQGHKILLIPIYTPTLTDEPNVSEHKILFGGISVYLEQNFGFFRKTPKLLDRIWDSPAVLKLASKSSIPTNPKLLGELTVSMLQGEAGHQRKEIPKMLEWLRHEAAPDLVSLPNSLLIGLAQPIRQALRRPVICTLQGEDLFLDGLQEPYRSQSLELMRAAAQNVDCFTAVSDFYAETMGRLLRIPDAKMRVLPLGINLTGYDPAARKSGNRFTIGYFARITPEKGLHVLCETYREMRCQPDFANATLEAAGYLAPEHRPYLQSIEREMKQCGLANEFHYRGILDRDQKIDFLRTLDVLSVPSTYDEPKGIFLLEALASGVPVVQPRRGAFPEIVNRTGGGILVEPDNIESLANGLLELWRNPNLRQELGRRGAEGVREYYSVSRMAARTIEIYTEVAAAGVAANTVPSAC